MKAILLAAGESTRMWPLAQEKNKCMYEILGKPIIQYTIEEFKNSGIKDFVIVVSPKEDSIRKKIGDGSALGVKIRYAVQKEAKGTGDALLAAKPHITDEAIFINATKGSAGNILKDLLMFIEHNKYPLVVSAHPTEHPELYAIVWNDGTKLKSIEEKPLKPRTNLKNMQLTYFKRDFLDFLEQEKEHPHSLIHAIDRYSKEKTAGVFIAEDTESFSLKYPWHLLEINKHMLRQLDRSIISPKANVHPSSVITGNVIIEDNAKVDAFVRIEGPCYIGKNTEIRSHCLLREFTSLGDNCVLGFGTETKNAILYNNTKTHNNYVGDSILDEDIRLGAYTVTANRRNDRENILSDIKGEKVDSGTTSLGTFIGSRTKTGIHVCLMPGIKIGKDCLVGPNTTLFTDLPDNSKAYTKAENIIKEK